MGILVAHIATPVKRLVATGANDSAALADLLLQAMQPTRIHKDKNPPRIHYIAEWAERRGLKQADIARATGADKSVVSRWFDGRLPETPNLLKIAAILNVEEPNELFRHPDDNWFKRMFEGRPQQDIDDSKELVSIHLRKTSSGT